MVATWFVARAEVRRRWRSVLALALLVTFVGIVVLTAAAGARRTSSALDRFRHATRARDVRVQVDDVEIRGAVLSAVEGLPEVLASARANFHPVFPDPSQVADDELDLAVLAPIGPELFRDVERPRVLRGRLPREGAVHEMALNELAATQTGLGVGDQLDVATFEPGALDTLFSGGGFPGFNGPEFRAEIVGITRLADELQGSDTQAGPMLLATPAFSARYGEIIDGLGEQLVARLRGGEADLSRVREAVRQAAGPDGEVFVETASSEYGRSVQDALSVLAMSLVVFTVVAGAAGALAVGGAVSRQMVATSFGGSTLRALGLTTRERALAATIPLAVGLGVGTAGAVAGAVAASPLMPLGLARRVEVDPGMAADATVLGIGAAVLLASGSAWAFATAWRRERSTGEAAVSPSASSLVTAAARIGLGPVSVTGLRYAFERGRARRAVPVRSALAATVLAVAGIVATAVVATSQSALLDDPARYGWGWSAEPDVDGTEAALDSLAADERIAAVALARNAVVEIEGRDVQGMAISPVRGRLEAVMLEGRRPGSPAEVALGSKTATSLGVEVGDTVAAVSSSGRSTEDLTVVGLAVFRPVDNPDPGDGALLTPAGLDAVSRSEGFESVLIRYPDGADRAEYEALLTEAHPVGFSVYSYPRPPGNVLNLDRTGGVLRALGAFFGVLGIAALAHALVLSARRRRHDVAVLLALGFVRRQARRVVAWQASAIVAVGLVLGVPLGLAAGRAVWRAMVGDLGVLDTPTTPVLLLTLIVPAALVVANVVAALPARSASRLRPAVTLRTE